VQNAANVKPKITPNVCQSSAKLWPNSHVSHVAEPNIFGRLLRPNFGVCRTSDRYFGNTVHCSTCSHTVKIYQNTHSPKCIKIERGFKSYCNYKTVHFFPTWYIWHGYSVAPSATESY